MAASCKVENYVDLSARYIFEPIAVETLGVLNASARHLLNDLGRRISLNSGEARETSFLYQRISILVQRFNAVLLHYLSLFLPNACTLLGQAKTHVLLDLSQQVCLACLICFY